jgi:HEAT repeat protein
LRSRWGRIDGVEKRDLRRAYRQANVGTLVAGLQDDRAAIRARAAHLLGYFAGPRSVAALIGALNDPNRGVRRTALRSLAWIGDPRAVPAIAAVALSDPSPELRSTAAVHLAKIDSADVVPALIETLDDPSRDVRMSALQALGRSGDERAIARGADVAVSDPALGPSSYAAETLAKLGDPRAAPLLLSLLTDTDRHLANGRYRTWLPEDSPRLFVHLWGHREAVKAHVQKWAAKQLVELGAVEVAPELATAAAEATSRRERRLLRRTVRRLQRVS